MAISLSIIIVIILLKYKPTYIVTLNGKEIGYIENETEFRERIQNEIIDKSGNNIDFVSLDEMPDYELKLVSRTQETNEEEIMIALEEKANVLYKYYAIVLNDETLGFVDNIEEAEQAVNKIQEEHKSDDIEIDLRVTENYTRNLEGIGIETVEVAQAQVEEKVTALIEEDEISKMPKINGIVLAVTPVSGRITSRYGVSSNIRSGAHTGTDIACSSGTPIKAVSAGEIVFSARSGSYGNLIKINHGNGVETWYAHCKTLYAKVGQKVEAGDVIAAVGSTGNSTGPHLHLEIRVNGKTINPQKYLYN